MRSRSRTIWMWRRSGTTLCWRRRTRCARRAAASLRGIDYTVAEPPNGVGGPGSPLLAAETTNTNPTAPTVTDLTSLNSTAQTTLSLSQLGAGFQYSTGPNIPLFDPQLIAMAGWLRRSDTVNLTNATGPTTGSGGSDDRRWAGAGLHGAEPWLRAGILDRRATGSDRQQRLGGAVWIDFEVRSVLCAEHLGDADYSRCCAGADAM